jgi:hypothetical protein
MTSKYIDHSKRPLKADEKLDATTLRDTELTEKELGKVTGGKGASGSTTTLFSKLNTGEHFKEAILHC